MAANKEYVQDGKKLANSIESGGFKARLFGYFAFYVPATFAYIIILMASRGFGGIINLTSLPHNIFGYTLFSSFLFLIPALPFIFWERSIRKFRRANGLSVYENIAAELEQREIDDRVAKEHKAYVNNGLVKESGSVDKSDIGYWFGLFQQGAISKDEYEAKKAELI